MPLTPDVAPDTPISTTWGNTIRNRTVQVFANTAERDSWGTPPNGAMCVTLDTYTLWFRRTGAWQQMTSQGLLEEYRSTGNFTVSAGGDAELWGAGALAKPLNPGHTLLVTVNFGAWEPTPENPTVLWVHGLVGPESTPPADTLYRPMGSVGVRDTNASMAIAVSFDSTLVWSITPDETPVTALSIRVTNVGGSAATIDSVIITATEV